MTVFIQILVSCCAFYGIYMIICAIRSILGEKALVENDCILTDNKTVIFAEPDKLEYLLHAAEAERNLWCKTIEVMIRAGDKGFEENLFIARAFCKKHADVIISII